MFCLLCKEVVFAIAIQLQFSAKRLYNFFEVEKLNAKQRFSKSQVCRTVVLMWNVLCFKDRLCRHILLLINPANDYLYHQKTHSGKRSTAASITSEMRTTMLPSFSCILFKFVLIFSSVRSRLHRTRKSVFYRAFIGCLMYLKKKLYPIQKGMSYVYLQFLKIIRSFLDTCWHFILGCNQIWIFSK